MGISSGDPVFTLPPFHVEQVFTSATETVDWGLTALGVPAAWKVSRGEGVKVAVLDTGISLSHTDLKAAVVKAKDFTRSRSGPADVQGHGTHAAGIVAARENSSGVIGVAPRASLLVAKVLGDSGAGTVAQIVAGVNWAVEQKADVISMSLTSPTGSPALEAAVAAALAAGVVVCAAAGNDGPVDDTVGFPARYPGVISVAAVNSRMGVPRFSSRGQRVDVAAPGDKILSCYPPNSLAVMSGTSMATPFVAGVAALVIAADRAGGTPELVGPARVAAVIKSTATDRGPVGWDKAYGWGVVDPVRATAAAAAAGREVALEPGDLTAAGKAKVAAAAGRPVDAAVRLKVL